MIHLSVYAEGEMKDLDSGSDTTSWSIGSKFTFNLGHLFKRGTLSNLFFIGKMN